jgi:hypothetical protein
MLHVRKRWQNRFGPLRREHLRQRGFMPGGWLRRRLQVQVW